MKANITDMFFSNLANFFSSSLSEIPAQYVLLAVFLIAFVPIPMPNEVMLTAVAGYEKQLQLPMLVWFTVAIILGELAWSSTLFYLIRNHLYRLKIVKKKEGNISPTHWLHKYGLYAFVLTPTVSAVVPYLNDVMTGIVAHKGVPYISFLKFITIGSIIRGIIGIMVFRGILGI